MENKKMEQLEKAAQGIVEFMKENCSPQDTVIVTSEQIKLVSDSIGIPINKFIPEDSLNGKHKDFFEEDSVPDIAIR